MTKHYDLCIKTGSYMKNGETKNSYENIGVMLDNGNGPFMLIKPWVNFAGFPREEGRNSVIVSLFAPKDTSPIREDRTISFDEQPAVNAESIPF